MTLPTFETMDQVQSALIEAVLHAPTATPRGMKTRELVATGFLLSRPRNRILRSPERRWSPALAVGELAWHLSGSDNVDEIAYYAPIWRKFSEDGMHIRGSCYGKRIFSSEDGVDSQWCRLLQLLRYDPQSRRAVLNLQDPSYRHSLNIQSPDVSCVTSCQFLIRDGALDAVVNMRSNDIVWGLPYDVFLFTMLQEMAAIELDVRLGRYFHFAGSLHLYERHFELASQISHARTVDGPDMRPMEALQEIPRFLDAERRIRSGTYEEMRLHPYWRDLLNEIQQYANGVNVRPGTWV